MNALKQYELWSDEEKEKYHNEWDNYKDSFHDMQLENNIDQMIVRLNYEDEWLQPHKNDFKITYITNYKDLDQSFSHRVELKLLFQKGFKWIVLNDKKRLYKEISVNCRRAIRSPETNICGWDNTKLCLFVKDNMLYAYTGASYYRNYNTFYFDYIGRIIKQDETVQLSMFDLI